MNYNKAVNCIKEKGWDTFLESLQHEYPDRELYCISKSWYHDEQYICKAKGVYGDIAIDWK